MPRFRIRVDVDDLLQTVQPGSFSKSQAQQLKAAVLISNCGGKQSELSVAGSITSSKQFEGEH